MKQKIAFLIQSLELGGAQKVVSQLVNSPELRDAYDIHLILLVNNIAYPIDRTVHIHHGHFERGGTLIQRIVRGIKKIIFIHSVCKKEGFACVVSHMRTSNIQLLLAGVRTHKIIVEHNVPTQAFSLKFPFNPLCKLLYWRANAVVFVSQRLQELWQTIPLPTRQEVIYNPAETDYKGSGKLCDMRFILGVGRLVEAKGFDILIKSFEMIDDPELHLVILGDGELRDQLLQQARSSTKSHLIRFVHNENDPRPYMIAASCFVLSSRWEGLPVVLLEALACKTKIVSFDCDCGPSEILGHGTFGLLVKTGDAKALAQAIEKSLANPLCYNNEQWHTHVKQFDISLIARKYVRLLQDVS